MLALAFEIGIADSCREVSAGLGAAIVRVAAVLVLASEATQPGTVAAAAATAPTAAPIASQALNCEASSTSWSLDFIKGDAGLARLPIHPKGQRNIAAILRKPAGAGRQNRQRSRCR